MEIKEIVIRMRNWLDCELAKNSEHRSDYYTKKLNLLNHWGNEIFAYLQDRELLVFNGRRDFINMTPDKII